ncbi:unnamed protein product [Ranitomeya imitator]|uniref:Regulator of chromosome condensation 1 n=1 Tax=Ranitomeya imitator TaxID=111125 RepID=A0ABN9KTC4_9NEOB|nr:unnamed protein product [Ranitomeya imitator]
MAHAPVTSTPDGKALPDNRRVDHKLERKRKPPMTLSEAHGGEDPRMRTAKPGVRRPSNWGPTWTCWTLLPNNTEKGNKSFRQLGLIDKGEEDVAFTQNDYFSCQMEMGVRKVACGGRHTLFLQEDGIVLSCGENLCGQLGRKTNTSSLEQIYSLEAQTIIDVSCGFNHSVAICNEGNIFTWGQGSEGQLGSGQFPQQSPIPRYSIILTSFYIWFY